jgi:hypothetical protein
LAVVHLVVVFSIAAIVAFVVVYEELLDADWLLVAIKHNDIP